MARALPLLSLLLALAGCSRTGLSVDGNLDLGRATRLVPTQSSYLDALDLLGPPTTVKSLAAGFQFDYASTRLEDWNLTAQYRAARGAYSQGVKSLWSVHLEFDGQGILRQRSLRLSVLDTGWGAMLGHTLQREPFFGAERYATRQHHATQRFLEMHSEPPSFGTLDSTLFQAGSHDDEVGVGD